MSEIECRLSKVVMSENHDQVIVLEQIDAKRRFPVVIGFNEVYAIHRFINNERPQRPYTHELIGNMLGALSVTIEKVLVNDLKDGIFYAILTLKQDGKTVEVDSRPSDAIALAVQAGAPIFVEESVIENASADIG